MKYKCLLFLIIPFTAFADTLLMSNVPNGCSGSLNTDTYLFATFTRNQYQCNTGYYVPANHDGCVVCPDIYDCNGGTFTFNEQVNQGNRLKMQIQITENIANGCKEGFLRAYNNSANITATFTPNVHNCSTGYYLPANTDGCTACPTGYTCSGGTYTFNETNDQGLSANNISITWINHTGDTITTNSCTYGTSITMPDAPTRTGYTFKGWKVVNDN